MEHLENNMIKKSAAPDYHESPFLPCKHRSPSFREYILEEYTLETVIGIPGVMTALVIAKSEQYELWLEEIS